MMYESYVHAVPSTKTIDEVKNAIKGCIRSHRESGLPTSKLPEEYQRQMGESIPFFRIGYLSLFHLLRDIKEIQYSYNELGESVLTVLQDDPCIFPTVMETDQLSRKRKMPCLDEILLHQMDGMSLSKTRK